MTENNKVIYDGQTLIDLTQDDVTQADVRQGVYFHNSAGVRGQGTLNIPSMFVVESHESASITTGAYSNRETSATFTKSGYYPLGIVGYYPVWVSGYTSAINFYIMCLSARSSGSATVYYGLQNTASTSVEYKLRFYILWVKE